MKLYLPLLNCSPPIVCHFSSIMYYSSATQRTGAPSLDRTPTTSLHYHPSYHQTDILQQVADIANGLDTFFLLFAVSFCDCSSTILVEVCTGDFSPESNGARRGRLRTKRLPPGRAPLLSRHGCMAAGCRWWRKAEAGNFLSFIFVAVYSAMIDDVSSACQPKPIYICSEYFLMIGRRAMACPAAGALQGFTF